MSDPYGTIGIYRKGGSIMAELFIDTIAEHITGAMQQEIGEELFDQWSNNNLEGFMQGYWKNDSLKFYGSNGLTKGWLKTLENYKKGYPTKEDSGTLKFTIKDISKIDKGSYWVMGEYHLKRMIGDANGVFLIIFKKIDGEWKIIADMSC